MLHTFLNHQWKAFWRSRNKGTGIAAQIFVGLAILYLLVLAVLVGFSMEQIIEKAFPDKDIFYAFNGFILYYFAVDSLIRMQLQELPTLSIVPYLHLKIPRHRIVHFLNLRSLFSFFNILPLFIFIPFCCTAIAEVYGSFVAIMYIVAIISLTVFNNYAVMYVKRLTTISIKAIVLAVLVIATCSLLEYFKILSISAISNSVFNILSLYPLIGFCFSIAALVLCMVNTAYLRKNMYAEELSTAQIKKASTDFPFLGRFGSVGVLAALELKLIFRHKRTRSSVMMTGFFMAYGFIFYKRDLIAQDQINMMIFAAVFMTGSSISMYGQFMFGWQSAHFDGLLVNKISLRDFIAAKFLLFTAFSTITTLIISLYSLISIKILYIQLAAYLYNIGIGTVVVLYLATWNSKAIDLSKRSTFNYQGVNATQLILLIPYFLVPYLFYLPFSHFGHPYWGVTALGLAGLIGLAARSYCISFLVRELNKRRHKIADGFRER